MSWAVLSPCICILADPQDPCPGARVPREPHMLTAVPAWGRSSPPPLTTQTPVPSLSGSPEHICPRPPCPPREQSGCSISTQGIYSSLVPSSVWGIFLALLDPRTMNRCPGQRPQGAQAREAGCPEAPPSWPWCPLWGSLGKHTHILASSCPSALGAPCRSSTESDS